MFYKNKCFVVLCVVSFCILFGVEKKSISIVKLALFSGYDYVGCFN